MKHGRLHSLQTLLTMLEQNWTSHLVCAQAGARACPFLRGVCGSILAAGQSSRSSDSAFTFYGRRVFFEEICLRGRQGFRPQGHGLHVFLDRFGFLKSVLDGLAVDRLGFR